MFSRRALHNPSLWQIGRGLSKSQSPAFTVRPQLHAPRIQQRSIKFRWPRDDKPAYNYDPEKHSKARPVYTARQRILRPPSDPRVLLLVLLATYGVYFRYSNMEEVPITGRRRFNCYSKEEMAEQGASIYRDIMEEEGEYILPQSDPIVQSVERVLKRLLPASGLADESWEVHVIDQPDKMNAFVIPGNKIFVYTGILEVCKNEDGLAAVLAHEIAHNVASHSAERRSEYLIVEKLLDALAFLNYTDVLSALLGRYVLDLGISRPASREQESEADYIGLLMMAQACYDPQAAVKMWRRMEKADEEYKSGPEFLSTHPSHANRITRISEWLPKAESIKSQKDCDIMAQYAMDFRRAWVQEFVRDDTDNK